jgi:6-phosphofructokinase 1
VLGYAQRGGSPTARSRLLGCQFGSKAVDLLLDDQGGRTVGLIHGELTDLSLEESCKSEKPLDLRLLKLANVLST